MRRSRLCSLFAGMRRDYSGLRAGLEFCDVGDGAREEIHHRERGVHRGKREIVRGEWCGAGAIESRVGVGFGGEISRRTRGGGNGAGRAGDDAECERAEGDAGRGVDRI
jgi:hypothetical protein